MDAARQFSDIATLIGEPARAIMLWNLLDGKAFTATELAISADVSAQSASMHLNKLVKAGLLSVESQGRHRYYRFSKPEVAYAIEAMINLIPMEKMTSTAKENKESMSGIKYCRTCYDHLAGKVGVAITDRLVKQKILVAAEIQYEITSKGIKWFSELGIDIHKLKNQRRSLARPCLDWSERRHHLAGALGAALLNKMLSAGWLSRVRNTRSIMITSKGQMKIHELLGLNV